MKPFQNIKVTCKVEITESEDRPPVTYEAVTTITGPLVDPAFTPDRIDQMHDPAWRTENNVRHYLTKR